MKKLDMKKAVETLEEGKDGNVFIGTEKAVFINGDVAGVISILTSFLRNAYAEGRIDDEILETMVYIVKNDNKKLMSMFTELLDELTEKIK